jgi:DDE superfamily endonuclease
VEVMLAGALAPAPPPLDGLVEPDLLAEVPADVESLMTLLPQADLDLQDDVQVALHPPLTRVWCRRGRRGQRLVEAPGANEKVYGFGVAAWRDGWFDGRLAVGRTAAVCCDPVRAAVARSQARGRVAIVVCDNAGTHTAAGSKLVRALVAELADALRLVYTPASDPEANRMEWLWRPLRRAVTPNHQRREVATLRADVEAEFAHLADHPQEVLAHLGSPGLALTDTAEPLASAA